MQNYYIIQEHVYGSVQKKHVMDDSVVAQHAAMVHPTHQPKPSLQKLPDQCQPLREAPRIALSLVSQPVLNR